MDTALMSQGSIELRQGEPLSLRDAAGRYIAVVSGTVWVTQEGDQSDYIVSAGEHFRFDRDGLALVMCLDGTAKLVLENGLITPHKPESPVVSVTRDNWFVHLPELKREARRTRDEAIGQAFADLFGGLRSLSGRLFGAISLAIRNRRSTQELRSLDDRILRDIGLDRDQVGPR